MIREGATLVSSADHIVEQLGSLLDFQLEMVGLGKDKTDSDEDLDPGQNSMENAMHKKVLSKIEFEPVCLDDLLQLTGLATQELVEILTDLELQGSVLHSPAGIQRLQ